MDLEVRWFEITVLLILYAKINDTYIESHKQNGVEFEFIISQPLNYHSKHVSRRNRREWDVYGFF